MFKAQSDLEILAQQKGEITGLPTGFYDLDKLTSGYMQRINYYSSAQVWVKPLCLILLAMLLLTHQAVAVFNMEMVLSNWP